jgi:hypothetical protein
MLMSLYQVTPASSSLDIDQSKAFVDQQKISENSMREGGQVLASIARNEMQHLTALPRGRMRFNFFKTRLTQPY